VQLPDVSERINGYGFVPTGGTAEAARKFLNDEMSRWEAAINAAGISPQ
jgi:tripartite-type tricarboxylate transporter receptor subunit TctC